MNTLEITAEISYFVAMQGQPDQALHCRYELVKFIDSEQPIEAELRSLESFRQAVMALVEEGARRSREEREDVSPPCVRVEMKGGEECKKPERELFVMLEEVVENGAWSLHMRCGREDYQELLSSRTEPLLELIKQFVEAETARWFSLVAFKGSLVE
jgi:hypothetical protein